MHDAGSRQIQLDAAPFAMMAYSAALEIIVGLTIPDAIRLVFLKYSRSMYRRMWTESADRYRLPSRVAPGPDGLRDHEDGRVLSSVFYSIGIQWAMHMAGRSVGPDVEEFCRSLRRVRQLNDEIIDVEEDILNGVLTSPLIFTLQSESSGAEFRSLLDEAWSNAADTGIDGQTTRRLMDLIHRADAFGATADMSLAQLDSAAQFIMASFHPEKSFEVTLLINQRLCTVLKRSRSGYTFVAETFVPELPWMRAANDGVEPTRRLGGNPRA